LPFGGDERFELLANARFDSVGDLQPVTGAAGAGMTLQRQSLPPPHPPNAVPGAERARDRKRDRL
jgi:hypothetical protein